VIEMSSKKKGNFDASKIYMGFSLLMFLFMIFILVTSIGIADETSISFLIFMTGMMLYFAILAVSYSMTSQLNKS
jgi:hypothetical protein